jgi:hypothetical protein
MLKLEKRHCLMFAVDCLVLLTIGRATIATGERLSNAKVCLLARQRWWLNWGSKRLFPKHAIIEKRDSIRSV